MNKLIKVNGTKEINEKEVRVIEGGFGENQKCILASDIAIQHEITDGNLNKLINNNLTRFNENDLCDLKLDKKSVLLLKNSEIFSQNKINASKNIYLLSERGYTKLVSMMDNSNEKKWEVMDNVIDNYFSMRQVINSDAQLKVNLLLSIYDGGQGAILASKQLTELEVKEATKELTQKIEEDKPLVEFGNQVLKSADNILVRELSKVAYEQGMNIGEKKLYKKLREWKYIMKNSTEPYQSAVNQGLFVVEEKPFTTVYGGVRISKTTKITPKGQIFIIEKLRKEIGEVK